MGACDFRVVAKGKTSREAFNAAVNEAAHENGHGGYTGTIAEKHSFVVIVASPKVLPDFMKQLRVKLSGENLTHFDNAVKLGRTAGAICDALIDLNDKRVSDKWGPAGCIVGPTDEKTGLTEYTFFGLASS